MFYTHFSLNNLYTDRNIYIYNRENNARGQGLQPDYQEIECYTKSDYFVFKYWWPLKG